MEKTIETLATKYGLSVEFFTELEAKVVDKENFVRAAKMFNDGLLPYDMATGKDPINVAEYRKTVAKNLREFRRNQQEKIKAAMEQQRKIVDYYAGCKRLSLHHKANKAISDVVFVKDGHLVAFAHFEPKKGGIYMANNEVMPNFRWHPHEYLARLRKMNKAFYRQVKKAAVNSPREWFDFNTKQ
jgi:hypothetical protein